MIAELCAMLTFFIPGLAILHALNVRGVFLPALGLIVGTSLYVALGVCQAAVGLSTLPQWTMAATWLIGATTWRAISKQQRSLDVRGLLMATTALVALVVFFRFFAPVRWNSDSFRNLLAGSAVARDSYYIVPGDLLTKRMATLAFLSAPANLGGEYYLRSLTPVLGLATVWVSCWLLIETLRWKAPPDGKYLVAGDPLISLNESGLSRQQRLGYTAAAMLLLVSVSRFLWNWFYINSHLMYAAYMLVLVGCGWLRVRQRSISSTAFIVLQSAGVLGVIFARPEGSLAAVLALLPFLACARLTRPERVVPLLVLGLGTIAWQAVVVRVSFNTGNPVAHSAWQLMALGGLLVCSSPFVVWRYVQRWRVYLLPTVEISVWLALAAFTLRRPDIMIDSFEATVANVALNKSAWGSSLLVLFALVLALVAFTRMPDRELLRFPLTTFVPFGFLLAYLREGSYRVGDGDSLTRMFVHIVPLCVLFIGAHLVADWRGPRSTPLASSALPPENGSDRPQTSEN